MLDLFWMDVMRKHKINTVAQPQSKMGKQLDQKVDLGVVTTMFDSYLANQIKDLVDVEKYPLFFNTVSELYDGNPNNIGFLTLQYDRKGLKDDCISKIKIKDQSFSIVMQKPQNDLELYEWVKGMSSSLLRGLSTEENGFDWGFCTLDLADSSVSMSSQARRKWAKDFAPTMESRGVNNLCVYVPATEASDSYSVDGKNIYFVPVTNHELDELHKRIDDNIDLFRENYNDPVGSLGPITIQDTTFGEGENAVHIFQDGAAAKNIDSTAEKMVTEIIDRVKLAMTGINGSETGLASSDFTFSEPHAVIAT